MNDFEIQPLAKVTVRLYGIIAVLTLRNLTVEGEADLAVTAFRVALSRCERKVFGTLRMIGLTNQASANGTVRLSSMAST